MEHNENEFMTSAEVCKYTGLGIAIINRADKEGDLKPSRKLATNHRRLYTKENVDAFLDKLRTSKF